MGESNKSLMSKAVGDLFAIDLPKKLSTHTTPPAMAEFFVVYVGHIACPVEAFKP